MSLGLHIVRVSHKKKFLIVFKEMVKPNKELLSASATVLTEWWRGGGGMVRRTR